MVALAEVLGFDPLELWPVKPMAKADDGVWRSTEDGSNIFISGDGEARAGGPEGPVVGQGDGDDKSSKKSDRKKGGKLDLEKQTSGPWVKIKAGNIGEIELQNKGGEYQIREVKVSESERGKGYGKKLYIAAIEHAHAEGAILRSDAATSPQAAAVWESLQRDGYPIVKEPLTELSGGKLYAVDEIEVAGQKLKIRNGKPIFRTEPKKTESKPNKEYSTTEFMASHGVNEEKAKWAGGVIEKLQSRFSGPSKAAAINEVLSAAQYPKYLAGIMQEYSGVGEAEAILAWSMKRGEMWAKSLIIRPIHRPVGRSIWTIKGVLVKSGDIDESNGQWVTMNGTPVFIEGDGEIGAGPESIKGKDVTEVDKGKSPDKQSGGSDAPKAGEAKAPVDFAVNAAKRFKVQNPDAPTSLSRYAKSYSGDEENPEWHPDRLKLHSSIQDHFVGSAKPVAFGEQPVAYLLGGGPASGKSSILKSGQVSVPENIVKVDCDGVKERLPDYEEMVANGGVERESAAAFVHNESSEVAGSIMKRGLEGRYNVLLDGTGNGSYKKLKSRATKMREAGHKVIAPYVTCDTELALSRAEERYKKTGRRVPDSIITETHKHVSQLFPQAVSEGMFDEWSLHDTTSGGDPVAVVSGKGKVGKIHDRAAWERFLLKGGPETVAKYAKMFD